MERIDTDRRWWQRDRLHFNSKTKSPKRKEPFRACAQAKASIFLIISQDLRQVHHSAHPGMRFPFPVVANETIYVLARLRPVRKHYVLIGTTVLLILFGHLDLLCWIQTY
jgi:hypothetical protein